MLKLRPMRLRLNRMTKQAATAFKGAAGLFICRISGSYSAIMGLPVCESGELLARFGAKAPILGL